jgi:hypothetical protein
MKNTKSYRIGKNVFYIHVGKRVCIQNIYPSPNPQNKTTTTKKLL